MVVLLSVVLLVISLMTLAALYVFYLRNPDGFSMANFGQWLKGWMTTTDHKGVGLLYLNFGLLFFLVGGVLALLFRIQLAIPMNDFLTEQEYNSFFTPVGRATSIVAAIIKKRNFGSMPLVSMWCPQTMNPTTPIPAIA